MITKPIAIFTADNHLTPNTWTRYPELYGDSYVSWHQIIDACLELQVPLIQLGDLFDKVRPDSKSVYEYLKGVQRLGDENLGFYYLQGNHDKASPAWARLYDKARHCQNLTIAGRKFYGIDFCDRDTLNQQVNCEKAVAADIILAHQSWRDIQQVGQCDGEFSMFPEGKILLTGDYHVTDMFMGQTANHETMLAYSPGSTSMQALNESPAKYYGLLYSSLEIAWQQLETRPYVEMTVLDAPSFDTLIQEIPATMSRVKYPSFETIQKPILHITYDQCIPDAYVRLQAVAADLCHLFANPVKQLEEQVIDTENTPEHAFDSLISAVDELCEPGTPTHTMASRLLRSNDPTAELKAIHNEFDPAG